MDSKTYTITLADGTVLDNLKLNGNNFISNTAINADIFNENCSPVIISDGVNSETYNNMELVQVTEQEPGKYWFVLRELSASELAWIKMQSDIEYVDDLARNYTNKKLNSLPSNAPTKTVSFDGGVYSISNDVVNGQVSACILKGLTATNLAQNGNFDGTTKWSGSGATVSAVNNVLSVTGNGTASNPRTYQPMSVKANNKYYVVAKARVTNDVCTRLNIYFGGGADKSISEILSPVQNQWYVLSGVVTTEDIAPNALYIASRYSSAETANGKVMEVQEVFAIDMTAGGLENLTADQMNAKFPHYFNGTKSTNSVRVKSVGKNLMPSFDEWDIGDNLYVNPNEIQVKFPNSFISPFIKINPNTGYVLSFVKIGGDLRSRLYYYDENKNLIENTVGSITTIWNINHPTAKYVRWNYYASSDETEYRTIKNMQLEYGTVSTEYEPYKESIVNVNLPEPLRSVPSVKDEINVTDGKKTQKVGSRILQADDINAMSTAYPNYDYAVMPKPVNFVGFKRISTSDNNAFRVSTDIKCSSTLNALSFWFYFPKGTTLEQARTTLAGTTLIYQLATPIVTKLPAQPPLQVFENGTIYVEPIGPLEETTLPTVEIEVPTGTSNKFGVATHDYGGAAADWVLTKNEANCGILIVTNAGGAANIIAPNDPGRFFFVKNDSGYDVVVKSAGAEAGTTIADGNSVIVFNTDD